MVKGAQLTLDLPFRPAFGREDFLVAAANEAAVLWIDQWPRWPVPALVLEGPPGAGKTHLSSVWQNQAHAAAIEGRDLTSALVPELLATSKNWVVENVQSAPDQPLLHFYNGSAEQGGTLLLIADGPPARWGTQLPDLSSRLAALPVASISAPDEDLIRAILMKLFADRHAATTLDVIDYLTVRIERSFDTARRIVAAIDAASLADRRRITVPLARQVLVQMSSGALKIE